MKLALANTLSIANDLLLDKLLDVLISALVSSTAVLVARKVSQCHLLGLGYFGSQLNEPERGNI